MNDIIETGYLMFFITSMLGDWRVARPLPGVTQKDERVSE